MENLKKKIKKTAKKQKKNAKRRLRRRTKIDYAITDEFHQQPPLPPTNELINWVQQSHQKDDLRDVFKKLNLQEEKPAERKEKKGLDENLLKRKPTKPNKPDHFLKMRARSDKGEEKNGGIIICT